jgi:hypothetical protein
MSHALAAGMSDPTLEEMREFIDSLPFAEERSEFDREEAIYWYANDWHGGQDSNLYSALSRSEFSPGAASRGPGETAQMIIEELEEHFK